MGLTVDTKYGTLRGQLREGVASFLGIPYAASPTGSKRFKAPMPPEPWTGVRDAVDPARFGPTIVASTMAFIPVIDGESLPEHPLARIGAGSGSQVPLMIGTNGDEFRTFLVPSGMTDLITEDVLVSMADAVGAGKEVIDVYRDNRPGVSPGNLLAALLTDRFFVLPALAVAEARAGGPAGRRQPISMSSPGNIHKSAPDMASMSRLCSTTWRPRERNSLRGATRRMTWRPRCTRPGSGLLRPVIPGG